MSQLARQRIAYNLNKYREKYGYTREQFSLLLGFDNSYVSKLEKCKINIPIDNLERIAIIFGIDIIDLLK